MDIKEYIASGLLELYVLERLEPAQMREVEAYTRQYPEISAEIDKIEQTLEAFAQSAAQEVNPDLLQRLLQETAREPQPSTKHEPGPGSTVTGGTSLLTWVGWALAVAALAGLLYSTTQLGNRTEALRATQQNLASLQADCADSQEVLRTTQQRLNELTNPATRGIILEGTDHAPDKQAIVYYNAATQKTLFKAANLPPPPIGKQYQLWAIDAEGPKDLGVLARDLGEDVLLEVNYLPGVAAFAITLEDEGGKPTPDLTALQVIGNV